MLYERRECRNFNYATVAPTELCYRVLQIAFPSVKVANSSAPDGRRCIGPGSPGRSGP